MVVRRDEGGPGAGHHLRDDGLALLRRRAAEDDVGAVGARRCDLGRRADGRHDDVGGDAARARREGEGLGVVAWLGERGVSWLVVQCWGSVRGCGGGLRGRMSRVHACQLAVTSPAGGGAGKG